MKELYKALDEIEKILGSSSEALQKAMLQATQKVQADAKRLTPVDSGQLRNSIVARIENDGDEIVGVVSTNSDHAFFVEFGTGPVGKASEKIVPEGMTLNYRDKGWNFKNPKTGDWVYTKGQKAQPFLYPALAQNKNKINEIVASVLNKELGKLQK